MKNFSTYAWQDNNEWVCIAGLRLRSVLSTELFWELIGQNAGGKSPSLLSALCHERWADLAHVLATLPHPVEGALIIANRPGQEPTWNLLTLSRNPVREQATAQAKRQANELKRIGGALLDYAELEVLSERKQLKNLADLFQFPHVLELRRRYAEIGATEKQLEGITPRIGLRAAGQTAGNDDGPDDEIRVRHLFPWVPSNSNWRPLFEILASENQPLGLIAHWRNWPQSPGSCREAARQALVNAERIVARDVGHNVRTVLTQQADALRNEALQRHEIVHGPTLAAKIFIASNHAPSDALLAVIQGSIDDASATGQKNTTTMFHSGVELHRTEASQVMARLGSPGLDLLFSPGECGAFLRTPMPTEVEIPGVLLNRSRTAVMSGQSGNDASLGVNVHRTLRQPVRMDGEDRFRHHYIIGQTGTGKSTLLHHLIHHDIMAGRGVAVLDPHGSLIEQILLHYPRERADDLVLVDVTDTQRPVGFNILCLPEKDPHRYRLARDLMIDDLYAYIDRTYDLHLTGGPIFETHFRGMLGLLMGIDPQKTAAIPNLMIFRSLYTNPGLRAALIQKLQGRDPLLDDFIQEAENARRDAALENLAVYITSKFNRFVSDLSLRNIVCQNTTLDLEDIVNTGKVLLFYTGRGRFGDQASGLLASQIVSRIRQVVMGRDLHDARPFYLYADEFQTFADERFAELLAEARKFKFSLTLAHQYTNQLPAQVLQGILGNIGTATILRVGPYDAEIFAPLLSPYFSARDIVSLPNFRAYVRSQGQLGQTPFSIELDPPPARGFKERAAELRHLSRLKYGRERETVEKEIAATYRHYQKMGS